MRHLGSFTFNRSYLAKTQDEDMAGNSGLSGHSAAEHSRSSSGASSGSTPITPTFSTSNRSHSRWPSSTSSLVSVPDSLANVTKSALHDLVEDPAEREDSFDLAPLGNPDEPLCICDDARCEHRRTVIMPKDWTVHSSSHAEWSPSDDSQSAASDRNSERSSKRRKSGEFSPTESFSMRLSRRMPSISKRWKDSRPTTSVTKTTVRSAPPSRSSSLRLPSFRRSMSTQADHSRTTSVPTPPYSPVDSQPEENELTRPQGMSRAQKPIDIKIPRPEDEPIDRQELSLTPLLPPLVDEHRALSQEALSPLQSPSVAGPSTTASVVGTPSFGPLITGMPTPPLSSQPSTASFNHGRGHLHATSDIPTMSISHTNDTWAVKLGHANFHIEPEPYFPETFTLQASQRLLDDWATARAQFTRQAERISEHYGPTSQIYKDTEAKWADIDGQWRAYHDRVKAEAQANGEVEEIQRTLARETKSTSKLPLPMLSDPEQPSKFPQIDDSDIVGPMVQYEVQRKRHITSSKTRPALLKLFTDPASLLDIMRK